MGGFSEDWLTLWNPRACVELDCCMMRLLLAALPLTRFWELLKVAFLNRFSSELWRKLLGLAVDVSMAEILWAAPVPLLLLLLPLDVLLYFRMLTTPLFLDPAAPEPISLPSFEFVSNGWLFFRLIWSDLYWKPMLEWLPPLAPSAAAAFLVDVFSF